MWEQGDLTPSTYGSEAAKEVCWGVFAQNQSLLAVNIPGSNFYDWQLTYLAELHEKRDFFRLLFIPMEMIGKSK